MSGEAIHKELRHIFDTGMGPRLTELKVKAALEESGARNVEVNIDENCQQMTIHYKMKGGRRIMRMTK